MRPPCGSVAISPCMNPRPCLFDLQHKPVCRAEPPRKAGRWKNIFLSNHSSFPQSQKRSRHLPQPMQGKGHSKLHDEYLTAVNMRSEEHTSELQSRENLVCRL